MTRKLWNWHGRSGKPRRKLRLGERRNNPLRNSSLGVELLEDRRLLAAGNLDTTFNPAGAIPGIKIGQFAPFGVGADGDRGVATAVQADGKIVVATQEYLAGFSVFFDVLVARYNTDGSADTTFGSGGSTSFDFTSGQSLVNDVAIDSLGRIVVAGSGPVGSTSGFTAARLTSTGVLDATFGTGGKVSNNFGGTQSSALAVAFQSDGKIVLGGVVGGAAAGNFGLVRFNVNGSLDDGSGSDSTPLDSFGTSGRVTTDFFGLRDVINDIAIQGDGKIVAAGVAATGANPANRNFALARYNVDGSLDTLFGPSLNGTVSTDIVTTAVQPGITFSDDTAYAVKIQSDGRIVVAGFTDVRTGLTDDNDMVVARYTTSGALDATFVPDPTPGRSSVSGTHRINFLTLGDFGRDILIQPDGKYVVVGMVNSGVFPISNYTIALARLVNNDPLLPDGSLDTTFSGDGLQQTSLGASYLASQTRVYAGALTPDGKIVVVGDGEQTAGPDHIEDYFIARYESGLATQSIAGASDVNEGANYTLTLTSSDPTTSQWTINWGDGTEIVPGNPSSVNHVYADGNANYTISATVTTSTGTAPIGNTVAVVVHNVAPTLTISGAAAVAEGALYTLNLSSFDPGTDTIASWTINWGDSIENVSGNPSSATHTYADGPNSYTISATATDEDGTFAAGNTVPVTVNNVAPTLTISGAASVAEAALYTLNLSSFDPGTDTINHWTINWGDSIENVSGNPSSATHTYADGPNSYTISASATDEDGTFAAGNTVPVTVNNVAPTLTISGAASVAEAALYALNLSSFDPGTDTITSWTINWGDSIENVSGNPSSATHTYADGPNSYTISASATDEDGTFAAGNTVPVTVNNVAPTLTISGATDVNEAALYALNLSSFDPGADTITSWTINWGDSIENVSGNPSSATHTYADGPNSYTISATATDEDGTFAAGNTVPVTVNNVAPTLTISGAAAVNEGALYTLNLSSFDPGTDTITSWTINWGDSIENVSGNPSSATHTYADGPNSYTISATATDEDGTFAAGNTVPVTVNNVAPTLTISGAAAVNEGALYTLNLSSFDPGTDTITSWTINWGDSIENVSGNPSSATHTYADGPNSYTISATATDEDGTFAAGNTVPVTVNNVAPTANDATFTLAENSPNGTVVGTVTATDPGTDTLSFSIVGGTGAAAFTIDSATGQITVSDASLLDFETTPTLTLNVQVSDGDGGFATASITVNLVNQASISGVVFVDINHNGLFDANEPGIDGVVVKLLDQNGNAVLDDLSHAITATTSSGGFYLFDDLDPGIYQIFEMQPTGVTDGAEHLGSLGGTVVANDRMQLTLAGIDAFDYAFAEFGQQLTSGDAATIGFWQNKHGQVLIAQGGTQLAAWLSSNFSNIFGNALVGASGADVATFYREQLFKQLSKKSAGPAKVDAQFMATVLATFFTSRTLAAEVAASYGFNVTDTGIGTKIVNVGTKGAAFNAANGSDRTIMQLLLATNSLTDQPNLIAGFATIYDTDGNGVISSAEAALRTMANDLYSFINEAGDI